MGCEYQADTLLNRMSDIVSQTGAGCKLSFEKTVVPKECKLLTQDNVQIRTDTQRG